MWVFSIDGEAIARSRRSSEGAGTVAMIGTAPPAARTVRGPRSWWCKQGARRSTQQRTTLQAL